MFGDVGQVHLVQMALNEAAASIAEGDPLAPEPDPVPQSVGKLEGLYRQERSRLMGFVRGMTRSDEAEDIVQRSFVRLIEKQNVEQLARPDAYLRQTARNIIVDGARSDARSGEAFHAAIDEMPIADSDPVVALEARDRLRRIEEAVTRLKPLTRQIFLACRVDGFSHAEIALQTGLSVKGVEKQMGKAIKQLSRHLRSHD